MRDGDLVTIGIAARAPLCERAAQPSASGSVMGGRGGGTAPGYFASAPIACSAARAHSMSWL